MCKIEKWSITKQHMDSTDYLNAGNRMPLFLPPPGARSYALLYATIVSKGQLV